MKNAILIFGLILISCILGCDTNEKENNIIVIVKYKTLPNKSVDALMGLKKLIGEVEKENHFVNLTLHIDQKDNSNILLYEEWNDELYYRNQHMKTKHLKEFIVEAQSYLAGPPDISFWKVNAVYK